MSEILTQEEIDSLLSAVRTGDASPLPAASPRPRRHQSILPYDFRRPNRIAKEQVRTLQMMHDTFARSVSSSLSAYLRSMVEVQLTSVEQLTYGEFMLSIVPPSSVDRISTTRPGRAAHTTRYFRITSWSFQIASISPSCRTLPFSRM